MEGHCWRHTSCIDKVAARSLLISRLITALPMPRTSAALNILHQIERESSDPWQIESMRNGQECKLRRSNQRSWWMQGPGPEAIHWNTWLGFLLLKLLRNSSVYGIFMMRRLFLKKFRLAAFVQIAATCWWGKFQFLYQSYFGTNFQSRGLVSLITGAFTKYVGLNFKPSSIFQTHPDVTIIQNRQLLWQKSAVLQNQGWCSIQERWNWCKSSPPTVTR